jgi:hypothetical protein
MKTTQETLKQRREKTNKKEWTGATLRGRQAWESRHCPLQVAFGVLTTLTPSPDRTIAPSAGYSLDSLLPGSLKEKMEEADKAEEPYSEFFEAVTEQELGELARKSEQEYAGEQRRLEEEKEEQEREALYCDEKMPESPLMFYCTVCGDACPMGDDVFAEDVCETCTNKY